MGKLAPGRFRDGEINNVLADLHVPDMVCARLGDVIPTDFKFMEGNATKVDRSSLTGESLSMIQSEGDEGYSGSGFKQGEIEAVMTSTSLNTFLGHAAEKIASGRPPCTAFLVRGEAGRAAGRLRGAEPCVIIAAGCLGVVNILVLIMGVLAKENAIVARLTYSEEMVGMLYAALSACTENIKVTDVMYHPT
ncbi:hypothetical protein PI126_g18580 [Phytophthora idaei]|nr:hypothetical protein PI126_g18580 [Phytophthora idaei]